MAVVLKAAVQKLTRISSEHGPRACRGGARIGSDTTSYIKMRPTGAPLRQSDLRPSLPVMEEGVHVRAGPYGNVALYVCTLEQSGSGDRAPARDSGSLGLYGTVDGSMSNIPAGEGWFRDVFERNGDITRFQPPTGVYLLDEIPYRRSICTAGIQRNWAGKQNVRRQRGTEMGDAPWGAGRSGRQRRLRRSERGASTVHNVSGGGRTATAPGRRRESALSRGGDRLTEHATSLQAYANTVLDSASVQEGENRTGGGDHVKHEGEPSVERRSNDVERSPREEYVQCVYTEKFVRSGYEIWKKQ